MSSNVFLENRAIF